MSSAAVQADIEQLRRAALALRRFHDTLQSRSHGLLGHWATELNNIFYGNLQAALLDALHLLEPRARDIATTAHALADRLETLAHRLGQADSLPKQPENSPLQLTGTTGLTVSDPALATTYTIGPPQRPAIAHDPGFLEGSAVERSPGLDDYIALAKWKSLLAAAEALRPDLADATAAYRHFLEGNGQDRQFSYERYVAADPSGAKALKNIIRDAQGGAEKLYQLLLHHDPTLAQQSVTFQLSSGAVPTEEGKARFPYPATENWQKTIGDHSLWTNATVTVNPGHPAEFKMQLTVHAEDRYNFNPGQKDIATAMPDAENGRFEECGLAQQYMHHATLSRTVTWQDTQFTTDESETVLEGEPDSRPRRPADNRRLRNRI